MEQTSWSLVDEPLGHVFWISSQVIKSLWRRKSGSSGDRNPRPSNDDYINVLPDFLCQLFFDAHWIRAISHCAYINCEVATSSIFQHCFRCSLNFLCQIWGAGGKQCDEAHPGNIYDVQVSGQSLLCSWNQASALTLSCLYRSRSPVLHYKGIWILDPLIPLKSLCWLHEIWKFKWSFGSIIPCTGLYWGNGAEEFWQKNMYNTVNTWSSRRNLS